MAKYRHKRSSTPGKIPTAGDLAVGELAINLNDKVLYTKTEDGQVIRVGADTYDRAEMERRFVPQGILPITRIGDLSTDPLPIVKASDTSLQITSIIPVMLSGRTYQIAAGSLEFRTGPTLTPPSDGTVNMYVELRDGGAVMTGVNSSQPETFTRVFVGTVVFQGGVMQSFNINKVSRLDIYRPSTTPQGSAFPVSSGTPDTTGTITW